MRVRIPPAAHTQKEHLAYLIGIALGDGNLSCPNGRATRLRITCDTKYPRLISEICATVAFLLPKNKVALVPRKTSNCLDISVYSNVLNEWMPWKVGRGPKAKQGAHVPAWVRKDMGLTALCLKGLIQTDGCLYVDRGYRMVNFTNNSKVLAEDARDMFAQLGFPPSFMRVAIGKGKYKYTARVARDAAELIQTLDLYKE